MNVVMDGERSKASSRSESHDRPCIWGSQEETHTPKNNTFPNEAIHGEEFVKPPVHEI